MKLRKVANAAEVLATFGADLPPGVREGDCEPGGGGTRRGRPDFGGQGGHGGHGGHVEERARTHERTYDQERARTQEPACLQERLADRFVDLHPEIVRNAILDAEDALLAGSAAASSAPGVKPAPAAKSAILQHAIGLAIWQQWRQFRDRALGRAGLSI